MTANSSTISTQSRCTHRFANGKRCRQFARPGSAACLRHAADTAANLAADLTADLAKFTQAEPINEFLSRLLLLLAQDRISPRRGAVMAYTANLLLRSVSVMHHQAVVAEKNRPVNIIWDIPGLERVSPDAAAGEQPVENR